MRLFGVSGAFFLFFFSVFFCFLDRYTRRTSIELWYRTRARRADYYSRRDRRVWRAMLCVCTEGYNACIASAITLISGSFDYLLRDRCVISHYYIYREYIWLCAFLSLVDAPFCASVSIFDFFTAFVLFRFVFHFHSVLYIGVATDTASNWLRKCISDYCGEGSIISRRSLLFHSEANNLIISGDRKKSNEIGNIMPQLFLYRSILFRKWEFLHLLCA